MSELAKVSWWLGRGPNPAAFRRYFADPFRAAAPQVRLEVIDVGAQGHAALLAALPTGDGPDILMVPRTGDFMTLVRAGHLLPLDAYIARYRWDERLLAPALQLASSGGHSYGVPRSLETMLLFYDKALFRAHGWRVPTSLPELAVLAADMQSHVIVPFGTGSGDFAGSCEWYVTLILNHFAGPAAVRQALVGELPWTSDIFAQALSLLVDWFRRGWFGTDYFTTTSTAGFARIGTGQAGMSPTVSWAFADAATVFAGRAADFGVAAFPSLRPAVTSPLYLLGTASILGINAAAAHPDAAAAVLDALFTNDVRRRFAEHLPGDWNLPLADPDQAGLAAVATPQFTAASTALTAAVTAGRAGYATWCFLTPAAEAATIDHFRALVEARMTVADYLTALDLACAADRADGASITIP